MYIQEIKALKKSNRFRTRQIFPSDIIDFASNDYLGLSTNKKLFKKAYKMVKKYHYHSPKASIVVNGYSQLHYKFEKLLSKLNNFEDCVTVGSGFLANISIFEALVRKRDILFVDEEYHASGILATKLIDNVVFFNHNDMEDLKNKIDLSSPKGRILIAVEGIYSMYGDIVKKEIFQIADSYNAILIVDEAHSNGVVGKKLLGVFDKYDIEIKPNYIKMGTLGKAYSSYGAYILGSNDIISFLVNRAKPIIYSTSLSLFDIALAYQNIKYIQRNKKQIKKQIKQKQKFVLDKLNISIDGLILPIPIGNNQKVLDIQADLLKQKILIGAIRPPTVKTAILRIIMRLNTKY